MNQSPRVQRAGLADVLDRILDKCIVVEPYQRVRLRGIDVLRRKKRLAATSIQTYLRFEGVVKAKHLQSRSLTSEPGSQHYPANFFDLLDRILDKSIVVDARQGIQIFGIDVLQMKPRTITASIQTYREHMTPRRSARAHKTGG